MQRDLRNYLWDIDKACEEILLFTAGKTFSDYQKDSLIRAGVERMFMTIGEALVQTAHHFPSQIADIPDFKSFIGFRNVLIHKYIDIVDENVWKAVASSVKPLQASVSSLRDELDRAAND